MYKHLEYIDGKRKKDKANMVKTFREMESLYTRLFELGYLEMPDKMYIQWLQSITKQREKYGNTKVKETLK